MSDTGYFPAFQVLVQNTNYVQVQDKLVVPKAYGCYMRLVSASLPITFYNLRGNSLQFNYRVKTESINRTFTFNVPLGHYTSSELADVCNWNGVLAGCSTPSQFFAVYQGQNNTFMMNFMPNSELSLFALTPGVLAHQMGFQVPYNDTAVPIPLPPANGLGTPWAASSLTFSGAYQGRPDLGGFFTTTLHDSPQYWNGVTGMSFVQGNFSAPFVASAFLLEGFSPFAGIIYLEGSNDPSTGFTVLATMTAADQIPNVAAQLAYTCTFYKVLPAMTAYQYYRYQVTNPNYDSLLTVFIAPALTTPLGTYFPAKLIPSTAQSPWNDPSYPLCLTTVADNGADLSGTNNIQVSTSYKVRYFSGGTNLLACVPVNCDYGETQQYTSDFTARLYDSVFSDFTVAFTDDRGNSINWNGCSWSLVLEFSFRAPDLLPLMQDQEDPNIAQQELRTEDYLDQQ